MKFSKIIKKIRKENNLTQEELAKELNVSRQAISNWETDKNLPDIELIIEISKAFSISLDELILGGENIKNVEQKLISDCSENKRVRMYMISNIIGIIFCILGFTLILLKGLTVEYVDELGIIHENFFLLPTGFTMILMGIVTIITGLIFYYKNTGDKKYVLIRLGYVFLICSVITSLLIYGNSNKIPVVTIITALIGAVFVGYGKLNNK